MEMGDGFPAKCTRMNADGELPTCTQHLDGSWDVTYPSAGTGMGGFGALFVLALLAGLAFTVWKVSTARRMARESGMDEGDATAMTLLTDDGFEATYLASNVRGRTAAPTATATPGRGTASERLRELDELLAEGLIDQEEYAATRRAILDSM